MKQKPNFRLKALRLLYGLKQSDIAKQLNISITTYNRKENGLRDFKESEIRRICEIFNKKPDEIFFKNGFEGGE